MQATATQLEVFVQTAQRVFGLDRHAGRGKHNPHSMRRPLQLSNEGLISDGTTPAEVRTLVSPFQFLTGIPERGCPPSRNELFADLPSVSLLVGEIGLGKTEFVFQLCEHLRRNQQARPPLPLPVNLSMCRWMGINPDQVLRSAPDWRNFARMIFAPVIRDLPDTGDDFLQDLIAAVHGGEVMLILDSLDELIAHRYQHRNFFEGIRALLDLAGPAPTRFRCLVSMRFEYVSSFDTPTGAELVRVLRRNGGSGGRLGVHFLHLDFLNDSWIQSYLHHTSSLESLVDKLGDYPAFYEMLQRPIFLNMIRAIDQSERSFKISELSHPVQLVRAFVEAAGAQDGVVADSPYFIERDAVARASGYTWDADKMARRALAKYQRTGGYVAFKPKDIVSFLVRAPGSEAPSQPLDAKDAVLCVQKCPFLHQFSEDTVVFSHNVFQEYFVARGIVLDLDESGGAFDRLVLNSDMRYSLRFLVDERYPDVDGEKEWYRRTRKSYALDRPEAWHLTGGRGLEDIAKGLDDVRKALLDYMTDPRNFDIDLARTTINRFFEYESQHLNPRYLMYNYEAVAVYLWRHRWQEDDLWLLNEFENRLINRARHLKFELEGELDDREGFELLAERIRSIGRRLQFSEITQMSLRDSIRSDDIKARMGAPDKPAMAGQEP